MDARTIKAVMAETGLDKDPAFKDLVLVIDKIPEEYQTDHRVLGLYFSDDDLAVIPPDADKSTLLHELGHAYGYHHYEDIGEPFAEAFRKRYETGNMMVFLHQETHFNCPDCHSRMDVQGDYAKCPRCGAAFHRVA